MKLYEKWKGNFKMFIFVYRKENSEWKMFAGVIAPDTETFKANPQQYFTDYQSTDAWSNKILENPVWDNAENKLREKTRAELYNEGKIQLKDWEIEKNGEIVAKEINIIQKNGTEMSPEERYLKRQDKLKEICDKVLFFSLIKYENEFHNTEKQKVKFLETLYLNSEAGQEENIDVIVEYEIKQMKKSEIIKLLEHFNTVEKNIIQEYKKISVKLEAEQIKEKAFEILDGAFEVLKNKKEEAINGL